MVSAIPARDDIEAAKDLVLAFWASMDATSDTSGEGHFSDAGVFRIDRGSSPIVELKGRDKVAAFSRQRLETARASKRITRHAVSNLRLVDARDGVIALNGYVTDYVGVGDPPLPTPSPVAVADFDYEIIWDVAGEWRLSRVHGRIIFAGAQ